MLSKKIGLTFVAASMAFANSAAQAETFSAMGAIPAQPMTAKQMKAVEGKVHIYLLVEERGVELPAQGEAATRAAAPTPESGKFRRSPSRDAAAFDFLPPPPTPTRI